MGSPEKIFPHAQLKSLSKQDLKVLGKEIKRHSTPAMRKIFAAHKRAAAALKPKVLPTLKRLKAKR